MSKGKMEKLHSRQEEKRKDYSLQEDQIRLKKSRLGLSSYSNSPIQKHESFPIILLRLKGVAIDPCNPRTSAGSVKQSWSLILKARKILFLRNTEFPWNKRNLHQFLRGTPTDTSDSASKKENEQSFTGLSSKQCSFASSVPCLLSRADSIESSNQPILRNPSLLAFDDSVSSSNSSRTEKPKRLNLQTCRRSIRLLNFIGDYLPRMTIPIGPHFQADVPDWPGTPTKENWYCCDGDSDNSRMHQMREERLWLGPAFLSWKFDEMGEEVSRLWTLKEHKTFKSIVEMNSISKGKSFWKTALKCFPSKNKESIVSYYLNVFVPRRRSMQMRSASEIINSDDDEADDTLKCMDSRKRYNMKTSYLIRRC